MSTLRFSKHSASSSARLKALLWGFSGLIGLLVALVMFIGQMEPAKSVQWTPEEVAVLSSLRLPEGGISVSDSSNRWLKNPEAIALGRRLFFDQRFSRHQTVACSTCHQPEHFFSDGQPFSQGSGGVTQRHTPSLIGVAAFRWQFWDGRADSLWAQALGPLEHVNEHGLDRMALVRRFMAYYGTDYQRLFGETMSLDALESLPAHASPKSSDARIVQAWEQLSDDQQTAINRIFANLGKSLAAFQATLMPTGSRFDQFVHQLEAQQEAQQHTANRRNPSQTPANPVLVEVSPAAGASLTASEQAGLKLFIDDNKGQCIRCHNGPLLSNGSFQATSVPPVENGHLASTPALTLTSALDSSEVGRAKGINEAWNNEFNCLGPYSDAAPEECGELQYAKRTGIELQRAFKVPTLRNIEFTAPYMHQGQFDNLLDLLRYYNDAPLNGFSHSELEPLGLLPHELRQLHAFLLSLSDTERRQTTKNISRFSG